MEKINGIQLKSDNSKSRGPEVVQIIEFFTLSGCAPESTIISGLPYMFRQFSASHIQ